MRLEQILFTQGFGTRRECRGLIQSGAVSVAATLRKDPDEEFEEEGLIFSVDGEQWQYLPKVVIALNKPEGYECSARPSAHPSVLSLIPFFLRNRGVQPVGRLDEDTTGLLLLTDDGALLHRLTHPRHHVSKVYVAELVHAAQETLPLRLLSGVMLRDESKPVSAQGCRLINEKTLELVLTQGKYHQVKRMIAAAGNRVGHLHRTQFGSVTLPEGLMPGKWALLSREEVERLEDRDERRA